MTGHDNLNKIRAEIGLTSLDNLLMQFHLRGRNHHHVAIQDTCVLPLVVFGDQGDEIKLVRILQSPLLRGAYAVVLDWCCGQWLISAESFL